MDVLKEKVLIDDTENGLLLQPADCDGFHICEIEGGSCVYVYYDEIDRLIDCIRRNILDDK